MPNLLYYILGSVFMVAGVIWLGVAWSWYMSFPLPWIWLVWALSSPIWFITGAFFLAVPIGEKMRMKRLSAKGMRIPTKFFNVEINFQFRFNYQYPYVIHTVGAAPKTGEKIIFTSENLWFNPEPFAKAQENIDVIIDPDNPSCYIMDLSFLEKAIKDAGKGV